MTLSTSAKRTLLPTHEVFLEDLAPSTAGTCSEPEEQARRAFSAVLRAVGVIGDDTVAETDEHDRGRLAAAAAAEGTMSLGTTGLDMLATVVGTARDSFGRAERTACMVK